jgi:hypothetical protein
MSNAAFDYLRTFKQVSEETEDLVIRKIRTRYPELTMKQVIECFENGVCGDYGDYYSLDPRTLLSWISKFTNNNSQSDRYLNQPLINPSLQITDIGYPTSPEQWMRETNKAYVSYLNNGDVTLFHPDIYDRLSLDQRIDRDACTPYISKNYHVPYAKQTAVGDYFKACKVNGVSLIYTL